MPPRSPVNTARDLPNSAPSFVASGSSGRATTAPWLVMFACAAFCVSDMSCIRQGLNFASGEDLDGDGRTNSSDDDIDGDLVPNSADDDMDGDGIPNMTDADNSKAIFAFTVRSSDNPALVSTCDCIVDDQRRSIVCRLQAEAVPNR